MTTTGRNAPGTRGGIVEQVATHPSGTPPGGVLVGVDTGRWARTGTGSDGPWAGGALAWAGEEARRSGLPLHLLTACAPVEPTTPTVGHVLTPWGEPRWDDAGALLAQLVAGPGDGDGDDVGRSPTTVETVVGHAAQVLLEACPTAGLLVLGQRGLGTVRRWAEGSTSVTVVGRSPVPVVVVPDDWAPPTTGAPGQPVTVGVDLHPDDLLTPVTGGEGNHAGRRRRQRAASAVTLAAAYAARRGVSLSVLSCWEPSPVLEWSLVQLEAHERRRAADITGWVEELPGRPPGVDVVVQARTGHADALLAAAAGTSSLVVVGHHPGRLRASGFPLGSTARALLRHAPGPVLVVPHR